MALVACGECGNEMSSEARGCPKCGWRPPRGTGKQILKWGMVVLLGVPLLMVAGVWTRNKAVGPEGWLRDDAEKAIRAKLIDPESLVMKESYFIRPDATSLALCGIFDAKNRMGGYTGGTRFVATAHASASSYSVIGVNTEEDEVKRQADKLGMLSAFETVYWNGHCVDESHPPLRAKE